MLVPLHLGDDRGQGATIAEPHQDRRRAATNAVVLVFKTFDEHWYRIARGRPHLGQHQHRKSLDRDVRLLQSSQQHGKLPYNAGIQISLKTARAVSLAFGLIHDVRVDDTAQRIHRMTI